MPVDPAESLPDAGFDVVRRGYDLGQVDTHLRRIDAEIAILAADRDAAVDQAAQLARELDDARARAEKLRAQVRTLAGPPQSVQGMSERMRSMLRLAEDEVADMLGRAETEAAQRRQEAEQEAAGLVAAAQEESIRTLGAAREEAASYLGPAQLEATELAERTMRERAQITTDRASMERKLAEDRAAMEQELAAHRDALEKRLADERVELQQRLADERAGVEKRLAERQSTVAQQLAAEQARVGHSLAAQRDTVERQLAEMARRAEAEQANRWSASERRRAVIEEDFTIAMDQRRSESLTALKAERDAIEYEVRHLRQANADRIRQDLARAEAEARRILADAERRVGELTALRTRIVEQLAGTGASLSRSLGALEPLPGEPAARADGPPTTDRHTNAPDPNAPEIDGRETSGRHRNLRDTGDRDDTPGDDTPTVHAEAATLTDLDPQGADPSRRPTPQRRPRAAAAARR